MGKKRIATAGSSNDSSAKKGGSNSSKRKVDAGILCIQSTYNNTKLVLTDTKGNALAWSSSGSLGFKGAKKGTPFAAAKVGEILADKAIAMGMKEISVVVKGTGSGREASIRSFITKGVGLVGVKDMTAVPFNGPKPPKPRRI